MPQNQHQQLSEEFALWLSMPTTQKFMAWLRRGIEETKEDFIRGGLVMSDQWTSGMKQAHAIGRCEMAQTILELDYQQLEKSDEE
jgi:hypothetical protein